MLSRPGDGSGVGLAHVDPAPSGSGRARSGTRPQAAKIEIVAETPTEVLEAMHHCMPSEA